MVAMAANARSVEQDEGMPVHMRRPLYRIAEDGTGRIVATFEEIDGFFTELSEDCPAPVTLIGVREVPSVLPLSASDVELQVRDRRGQLIGRYYIGRVTVEAPAGMQGSDDLKADFFGYRKPYPYASEIWAAWAAGRPAASGAWMQLPPAAHASWLHVVQNAWFTAGNKASCVYCDNSREVDIQGSELTSVASIYCALGEAFNGPGGYFGSNPNALVDCLQQSCEFRPLHPRIHFYELSAAKLNVGGEEIDFAISALQRFGVDVCVH